MEPNVEFLLLSNNRFVTIINSRTLFNLLTISTIGFKQDATELHSPTVNYKISVSQKT